ncbi:uncharacterized protein LOC123530842 [Mercenaria mercenaria]|uniref:uncharacterized protein LOC123530842 n=1 Tax=Mercenaria mercenaria TaxID=6596 RepID=UPI00234ECFAE|nr:uncharacterized protein LOC123530842 [Mercenaria mercenaria]
MELNTAQSLLLLGAAGTGKTYLLKQIVQALKSEGKSVALTATTRIACCLYDDASTIHRWSGISDGRHDVSEIRKVIENNVQFVEVRKRITQTDVLVTDECSMLSKRLFEYLDEVCKLKDQKHSFGGIQLVLSGDFTQLPPVPNQLYGEEGEFCFESKLFENILPHRVTLTEVRRQSEKDLIKAIHEVANGNVTKETETFIHGLSRPLPCDTESITLFARNEQVDEYNRNRIIEFPGQFEFQSSDEGDQKHLNKILAPKTLRLKKGALVILLHNLSDKLVNGLCGHVYDICETGPVVEFKFPTLSIKVQLEKLRFSVFSPSRNTDVAIRLQYPVKLSFAMSIHKSQGLTLESLEIDCRQIFKPGKLGVALGRAPETKGLLVINFNAKQSVIPQPASVLNFLQKFIC